MVIIPRRMISNCAHARRNLKVSFNWDQIFHLHVILNDKFVKFWPINPFALNSLPKITIFFLLVCFYPQNCVKKTVKSHHFLNVEVMIFWQKFLNLLEFRNCEKLLRLENIFKIEKWQRSRFPKSWRKKMKKLMMSTKH